MMSTRAKASTWRVQGKRERVEGDSSGWSSRSKMAEGTSDKVRVGAHAGRP
jgi:hypothetical protein